MYGPNRQRIIEFYEPWCLVSLLSGLSHSSCAVCWVDVRSSPFSRSHRLGSVGYLVRGAHAHTHLQTLGNYTYVGEQPSWVTEEKKKRRRTPGNQKTQCLLPCIQTCARRRLQLRTSILSSCPSEWHLYDQWTPCNKGWLRLEDSPSLLHHQVKSFQLPSNELAGQCPSR